MEEKVVSINIWMQNEIDQELEKKLEVNCPQPHHTDKRKNLTMDDFEQLTEGKESKNCPHIDLQKIESICLVGKVNDNVLSRISQFCPQFKCFHISSAKFVRESLKQLLKMAPKLESLSSNGTIKIKYRSSSLDYLGSFIQECQNLEDWNLKITSNDNFDDKCFENVTNKLIYLYLKDEKLNNQLVNLMDKLSRGERENLEFLRIENDEEFFKAQKALKYIAKLTKLRGLNISTNNEVIYKKDYYECIANMEYLETLTIRMGHSEYCPDHNEILKVISKSKFKNRLLRFKVIDAELEWKSFKRIIDSFKNLESLQLTDCVVSLNDIKSITNGIIRMKSLTELMIENRDEINEDDDYRPLNLDNFKHILTKSSNLKHFYLQLLEDVTNTHQQEISNMKEIAQRRKIQLIV